MGLKGAELAVLQKGKDLPHSCCSLASWWAQSLPVQHLCLAVLHDLLEQTQQGVSAAVLPPCVPSCSRVWAASTAGEREVGACGWMEVAVVALLGSTQRLPVTIGKGSQRIRAE